MKQYNKCMRKLYCYVDETGQDTAGRFFAVSVLVTKAEREKLLKKLEDIEKRSGKGNIKWHKSKRRHREKYLEEITQVTELHHSLFVATYHDSKNYLVHTADAIIKSLRRKRGDRAIIYVDALKDAEQQKLKRQLRPSVMIPTKVRGVKREENNTFIRLVDAVCGLVRDAEDGRAWAKKMIRRLKKRDLLESL